MRFMGVGMDWEKVGSEMKRNAEDAEFGEEEAEKERCGWAEVRKRSLVKEE
jgi:hypothetical protein